MTDTISSCKKKLNERIAQATRLAGDLLKQAVPVSNAEGYFIHPDGIVLSTKRKKPLSLSAVIHNSGYYTVNLRIENTCVRKYVHQLVARHFLVVPSTQNACVRHLDGNPLNNKVENLAWGSVKDNSSDMIRHGRSLVGENNPASKLSSCDVEVIKRMLDLGSSTHYLALIFDVSQPTIHNIARNRVWKALDNGRRP